MSLYGLIFLSYKDLVHRMSTCEASVIHLFRRLAHNQVSVVLHLKHRDLAARVSHEKGISLRVKSDINWHVHLSFVFKVDYH